MFTVLIYSSEKPAVLEMHSWHVEIKINTIFKYFLNDNDVTKQIKVLHSVMNEIKLYRHLLWDVYCERWLNSAVISSLWEQTPSWVCGLCDFLLSSKCHLKKKVNSNYILIWEFSNPFWDPLEIPREVTKPRLVITIVMTCFICFSP